MQKDLGLEFLKQRPWDRKSYFCKFYKMNTCNIFSSQLLSDALDKLLEGAQNSFFRNIT